MWRLAVILCLYVEGVLSLNSCKRYSYLHVCLWCSTSLCRCQCIVISCGTAIHDITQTAIVHPIFGDFYSIAMIVFNIETYFAYFPIDRSEVLIKRKQIFHNPVVSEKFSPKSRYTHKWRCRDILIHAHT